MFLVEGPGPFRPGTRKRDGPVNFGGTTPPSGLGAVVPYLRTKTKLRAPRKRLLLPKKRLLLPPTMTTLPPPCLLRRLCILSHPLPSLVGVSVAS